MGRVCPLFPHLVLAEANNVRGCRRYNQQTQGIQAPCSQQPGAIKVKPGAWSTQGGRPKFFNILASEDAPLHTQDPKASRGIPAVVVAERPLQVAGRCSCAADASQTPSFPKWTQKGTVCVPLQWLIGAPKRKQLRWSSCTPLSSHVPSHPLRMENNTDFFRLYI